MPNIDLAGNTLICKDIQVGATTPGSTGTSLSSTELSYVDGITAGTALASKAVVLDSSKGVSTITSATITTLTSTLVTAPAVTSATNLALNGTGSGTIAVGNVSTGAVTITPATTVTGALTPTGGIAAAGGFTTSARNWATGSNPAGAAGDGTDATPSVTETYYAEVFVPANATLTGIATFNGSATGSGNIRVFLTNSAGTNLASSAATTAISGTDTYQRVPFSSTYAAKGPATYYVVTQYDNTSTRFNTHVVGNFGAGKDTGTTFGTFPVSPTIPTTFTTGLGPIASLY